MNNKVIFTKEEDNLIISIANLKQQFNLVDVKINNDELTEFLVDLSSYFNVEPFVYEVVPKEAINDDKIKFFINLISEFIKIFKQELNQYKTQYNQQIKNIKTKINE